MNFLLIQNFFGPEAQIVRGNQVIFHPALPSGDGQAVAPAVEMAVKAAADLIALQQLDDLLTAVALIEGRIVEKAVLLPLPRRLQRRLQADQLPVEDLGTVPARSSS